VRFASVIREHLRNSDLQVSREIWIAIFDPCIVDESEGEETNDIQAGNLSMMTIRDNDARRFPKRSLPSPNGIDYSIDDRESKSRFAFGYARLSESLSKIDSGDANAGFIAPNGARSIFNRTRDRIS